MITNTNNIQGEGLFKIFERLSKDKENSEQNRNIVLNWLACDLWNNALTISCFDVKLSMIGLTGRQLSQNLLKLGFFEENCSGQFNKEVK